MAGLLDLIDKTTEAGLNFADIVFGPLTEPELDPKYRTNWDELIDEKRTEICKDPRMAVIAKINPYNAVQQLARERHVLDFSDRKVAFLDRIYTLKRTFIFRHNQPSKNVGPSTFEEVMAEYNHLKTCNDEFNNEDERKQYFTLIDRWMHQIIQIRSVWKQFEEDLQMLKKIAVNDELVKTNPKLFEELLGQPWSQFLDGEAPGWSSDWANGGSVVAKQRIPNAALRIVEGWEKETAAVYRDIDEARGHGESRFQSGLEHQKKTRVLSADKKSYRTMNVGMAPVSPFPKVFEGLEHFDGDLFPANRLISHVDGHRSAAGWKAATLQLKKIGKPSTSAHIEQVDA